MTDDQLRAHPRYVADPPIEGVFENVAIALVNISVRGALIRHTEPIEGLSNGLLKVSAFKAFDAALHAEIIWTRGNTMSSGTAWESGLLFTQWIEVAQGVIERLLKARSIHLDASRPPSMHRGGVV